MNHRKRKAGFVHFSLLAHTWSRDEKMKMAALVVARQATSATCSTSQLNDKLANQPMSIFLSGIHLCLPWQMPRLPSRMQSC